MTAERTSSFFSKAGRRLVSGIPEETIADIGLRRSGTSVGTALLWAGVGAVVGAAIGAAAVYLTSKQSRVHLRMLGEWLARVPTEAAPTPDVEVAAKKAEGNGPAHAARASAA